MVSALRPLVGGLAIHVAGAMALLHASAAFAQSGPTLGPSTHSVSGTATLAIGWPQLSALQARFQGVSSGTFNPYTGSETWRFSLAEAAHAVVIVHRSGQPGPAVTHDLGARSAGNQSFIWDGRMPDGQLAPADWYWVSVITRDTLGNVANAAFGGVHIRPVSPTKHIVVVLSQQRLYAYEGTQVVYTSLVTTGNPRLPTPIGQFHIFAKYHPIQFTSPWPYGSPYWYPPEWINYALAFQQGGYFIHDAPWRSVFGPASQGGGQPGTNYGGSHGCVNVPTPTGQFLFNWAPIGTKVAVRA